MLVALGRLEHQVYRGQARELSMRSVGVRQPRWRVSYALSLLTFLNVF